MSARSIGLVAVVLLSAAFFAGCDSVSQQVPADGGTLLDGGAEADAGTVPLGTDEPVYAGAANQHLMASEDFTGYPDGQSFVQTGGTQTYRRGFGFDGTATGWAAEGAAVEIFYEQSHGAQNHVIWDRTTRDIPSTRRRQYVTVMHRSQGPSTGHPAFKSGSSGKKHIIILREDSQNRSSLHSGGHSVNLDTYAGGGTNGEPMNPKYSGFWKNSVPALTPAEVEDRVQSSGTLYADRAWMDGRWHRYTYELMPSSARGAADGYLRTWADGVLVDDSGPLSIGPAGIGGVTLAGTFNGYWFDGVSWADGSPQDQREWYTRLRVWWED